jgi:hypothetical protein
MNPEGFGIVADVAWQEGDADLRGKGNDDNMATSCWKRPCFF